MAGLPDSKGAGDSPRRPSKGLRVQPLWALAGFVWLLASLVLAALQTLSPNERVLRTLWDAIRYPLEISGARRLEVAPRLIADVAVLADGRRAWAVGDHGAILVTSDGGERWSTQISGVDSYLSSVQVSTDGLHGWAVGAGGTILATRNGGRHWSPQGSGVHIFLSALHFNADGRHGWAVGADGTILATVDGGAHWAPVPSGVHANLLAIGFQPNGLQGWAVGGNGTILGSRDGGRHWTVQPGTTQAHLAAVAFSADGLLGWAVGAGGTILSTRDGGGHWSRQASRVVADLRAVHFDVAGRRGWAAGADGTLLATGDGGEHWAPQSSGVTSDLLSLAFASDDRDGWATGASGTILATRDGGEHWASQASGVQSSLHALQFDTQGRRGWAAGAGGSILASTDGGLHWRAQASGVTASLSALLMNADGLRGWAVGDAGTLLLTQDGGQTWTRQLHDVQAHLRSVDFDAQGRHGWLVGTGGLVLATSDGGFHWSPQASGVDSDLHTVRFDAEGQRGWIVGSGGAILASEDGGTHWSVLGRSTTATLSSVHFDADGRRGWCAGSAGVIVATTDAGAHWTSQASGVHADLRAVQFAADGLHGWVVGEEGVVLATADAGAKWSRVFSANADAARRAVWIGDAHGMDVRIAGDPPSLLHTSDGGASWTVERWPLRYSRYPAIWLWFSLLGVALCWWRALRAVAADVRGAEAILMSDAPAMEFAKDRLGFGPVAQGISRFLRNMATEPPLTFAISGDWGSGKSSLMGLVCHDLRRHGHRPVWFNAWHHQKDEQLLAALLNAIRTQGLPPAWTPAGVAFRLRLLWLRSMKHFLVAFVFLLASAVVISFMGTHDVAAWGHLWALMAGQAAPASASELGRIAAQLAASAAALLALRKAMTAFGADPAVLLSATAEQFKLKDASALTNFRAQFAEQFDEVTRTLPYRMVIVIDDLDRCRPEVTLDVLEAVNFLVSSGTCFVIFGMATQRVQAGLALSFEKIANEMNDLGTPGEAPGRGAASKERLDREHRRVYARDYLEKLVNLEVPVPAMDDERLAALLEPTQEEARVGPWQVLRPIMALWPLAMAALAVWLGAGLGALWQVPASLDGHVLHLTTPEGPAAAPSSVAAASASSATSPSAPVALQPLPASTRPAHAGDEQDVAWYFFGLPTCLLVIWGAGYARFRLRAVQDEVKDSPVFQHALRIWQPVVRWRRKTPRAVKRFGNRFRYLAMLQQAQVLEESEWDSLLGQGAAWMRSRFGSIEETPAPIAAQSQHGLGEDLIVALGAIHEVSGERWRECLAGAYGDAALKASVAEAIQRHLKAVPGSTWPPSSEALARFERALKGIRVPA